MEQKTLSRWLKAALIAVGLCGLAVCALILPSCAQSVLDAYPEMKDRYWAWLIFLWITALPCFAALIVGWRIAHNIGRDRSFSNENARHLKRISQLAAGDTAFFFAGNVLLMLLNMSHPGVLLASLLISLVGVAVTVAAAALSHLVLKAALLQEQSDLTI